MSFKILSINPGSTSTKIAIFEDEKEIFGTNIKHTAEELAPFTDIPDQYEFRKNIVIEEIKKAGFELSELSAAVGRGGIFPNIKAGGYAVNEKMKHMVFHGSIVPHASNLGALISSAIAEPLGIPAYVYDCVSADEMNEIARVTGLPEIVRTSICHVLNTKAMGRKVAEKHGKKYEEMDFVIAHLGGGISLSAHGKGVIVDMISDDEGPFSPERAGGLPALQMIKLCYSGKFTEKEIGKHIRGKGGLLAHFGTADCIEIEKRIADGDERAKLVYDAMAYNVAKNIGRLAPALKFKMDAVIITGGIAYSKYLTDKICEYLGDFTKIEIAPGENEMESLSLGALRILRGEEAAKEYN